MDRISAIYCIENTITFEKYIGASADIKKRWNKHKNYLRKGIHWNFLLQEDYNIYGKDCYNYKIIQYLPPDKNKLKLMETYWIVYYDSYVEFGKGFNLTLGDYNFYPSKITLERMRRAQEGKVLSEETKEKISEFMSSDRNPNIGRKHSEETRQKMSESGKIKIFTEEHKKHLSESLSGKNHPWFGKHLPEETKEKIAEAQRGEKSPRFNWQYNEKEIESISKGRQGIKNSGEHSSIYVGVSFFSRNKKWKAGITYKKTAYHLGFFDNEIDAAKAYDKKAKELFGNNAKTNFEEDD
jgi:group I intron endonuclease